MKINITKIGNKLSSFIKFLSSMTLIEIVILVNIIAILGAIATGG